MHEQLSMTGVESYVPEPDDCLEPVASAAEVTAAKRAASLRHFSAIKDHRTSAILVVNVDREGTHNYIGPNAFAEVAIAIAEGRDVFLLQGIPASYADELRAWGVTCLHGDLGRIKGRLAGRGKRRTPPVHPPGQDALFQG